MTPKEKAIEIYDKMFNIIHINEEQKYYDSADKAALILVDEIINTLNIYPVYQLKDSELEQLNYWKEVGKEIKKL